MKHHLNTPSYALMILIMIFLAIFAVMNSVLCVVLTMQGDIDFIGSINMHFLSVILLLVAWLIWEVLKYIFQTKD